VRIGRGQAPGRGDRLVEGRVESSAVGIDERWQGVDVGALQLRIEPPVEDLADRRVGRSELFEDRRVGRVTGLRAPALGHVQLEEEDLLELLGTAEVEL